MWRSALWLMVCAAVASAQEQGTLSGQVVDTLGARVTGASVTLIARGSQVTETKSDAEGTFTFRNLPAGRYQVTATAQGFQPRTSDPVYAGPGTRASVEVVLEVGPLQQDVVVTAEAGQVLQSQTGAPVTVIDSATLEALNKPDVLEALRLVPGAQIVQVGERGGATSLFLRGGNSNFTKVLVDGMPANDIGGGFDFSQLDTAGVDRIEVLRQTNSVVYGSDALTGVVNITTRRGSARVPEFQYAHRRRQPAHVPELDLARRRGAALRLLLAVLRTSRPTTTRRTAAITAARMPDASASPSAAART